ncbi:carbonic anhydrase [Paenibacillus baekrokdamisoli]|uniref:carbonic anhydrase n=1 Tax=Paenibacillus baekrokdamisoli TaxID=1712516 RepID=A0A3G9J1N7_9BACL|nr:carbonic anhydrase [Paenibacillus baekrokdamisoli]MBB3067048.1 carbonic anhydrase [Paenibacillus baekrokdamisoli]BBH19761.1 carbonic anhydrase [Paenibacillus baekrokdamisoli]
MNNIKEILAYNEQFVENREYEKYLTNRFPDKKMVLVTCMDARLTELLPKALNLRNGDAKIIKNAGAIVTQPFGNIMRSILIATYELGADEVVVIGHYDCGMTGLNPDSVIHHMLESGVTEETITTLRNSGMHLERWLTGFDSVQESVERSVSIISNHPLLSATTPVHGLIIHPETGKLDLVVDGYEALKLKNKAK